MSTAIAPITHTRRLVNRVGLGQITEDLLKHQRVAAEVACGDAGKLDKLRLIAPAIAVDVAATNSRRVMGWSVLLTSDLR